MSRLSFRDTSNIKIDKSRKDFGRLRYIHKLHNGELAPDIYKRQHIIPKHGDSNLFKFCKIINCNLRYVIVWDLDETLLFFDESATIMERPAYYLRPYYDKVLYYCNKLPNSINVLWSMGSDVYVHDAIHQTKLNTFFQLVLTRSDCKKSLQQFGVNKSILYVRNAIGLHDDHMIYSILVDDKAKQNSECSNMGFVNYTNLITLKPFSGELINRMLTQNLIDTTLINVHKVLVEFYMKYN